MYDDWVDTATRELSKREIITKALAVVRAVEGVRGDEVAAALEPDLSGGQINGGCAATAILKLAVKHGREVGQHGSPECRINGVDARTSSSWAVDQWSAVIDGLLAPAVQRSS